MVTVAVAGGTGGVGKTIVEELVRGAKHEVVVLSRKASNVAGLDVPVIALDYTDPASMQRVLDEHKIEVVISALILASDETSKSQLNLIEAAGNSASVKRFMPSEWGIDNTPDLYSFYPAAKWWVDAIDTLRKTKLEYTRVMMGFLMDTFGLPRVRSNMKPITYVMDFENHRAAVPGDGETPITMLHTVDLAKYVAALLDLEDWPEVSAFAGERFTWNEAVRAAEKAMGVKWTVTYDTVEQLEKGNATHFPQPEGTYTEYSDEEYKEMWSGFGIIAVKGIMDVSGKGLMNDKFPHIKPMTMMEMIEKAWGKKQ